MTYLQKLGTILIFPFQHSTSIKEVVRPAGRRVAGLYVAGKKLVFPEKSIRFCPGHIYIWPTWPNEDINVNKTKIKGDLKMFHNMNKKL